jgi:hypothetical protein
MTVTVQWLETGVRRQFSGATDGTDVLQSNITLHADNRFEHIDYVLNDFTQMTGFFTSGSEIEALVASDSTAAQLNPDVTIVLVAQNQALLEWIQHYGDQMKDAAYGVSVFTELSDAENYIAQMTSGG